MIERKREREKEEGWKGREKQRLSMGMDLKRDMYSSQLHYSHPFKI